MERTRRTYTLRYRWKVFAYWEKTTEFRISKDSTKSKWFKSNLANK